MKVFVKATPAPRPRSQSAGQIGLIYAGIVTLTALAQLFSFDEFITLYSAPEFRIESLVAALLPPFIVACEVFALPFLLRMSVSPAFRWVSMVCGWVVSATWLYVALVTVNMYPVITNMGLAGTVIDLIPGWWAVGVALIFGIMAAWASWGLWPGALRKVSGSAKKPRQKS